MNKIESSERELEVLQRIHQNRAHIRQRDLARIVGLSLGMTNAIIKRLVQKGWLKARKVNERNIHYVVSPRGLDAIARRSYRYLKRTVRNVVLYKEAIDRYIGDARRDGYRGIALVGPSDLDFIIEHLCLQHGLELHRTARMEGERDLFYIFSENIPKSDADNQQVTPALLVQPASIHLRDILVNL